jgi:hypothetical protein
MTPSTRTAIVHNNNHVQKPHHVWPSNHSSMKGEEKRKPVRICSIDSVEESNANAVGFYKSLVLNSKQHDYLKRKERYNNILILHDRSKSGHIEL